VFRGAALHNDRLIKMYELLSQALGTSMMQSAHQIITRITHTSTHTHTHSQRATQCNVGQLVRGTKALPVNYDIVIEYSNYVWPKW